MIVEDELREETESCFKLLRNGEAVIFRVVTFTDLKKTLEGRFASGAFIVLYDAGRGCGRRSSQRLMQIYPDREELLKAIAQNKRSEGWGNIRFQLDMENGTGKVVLVESFEAKEYGPSQQPVCWFFRGYLEGALSQAFNKPLKATETACIARGDKQCVFQI
ncbi:MAG: V4R domain-containing protein [Candidatus Bathyarchaeia archaeon]